MGLLAALTVLTPILLFTLAPQLLESPGQVAMALALAVLQLGLAFAVLRTGRAPAVAVVLAAGALIVVVGNVLRIGDIAMLSGTWMLAYLSPALLLLLAPDGRPATRRSARVGWALGTVVVAFIVIAGLADGLRLDSLPLWVTVGALLLAFLVLLVACAATPIARYLRADDDERLRLRWLVAAGLSLPLTLLLCWASYLVLGVADLVVYGLVVMLVVVPLGAAISVAWPRLFDIDRALIGALTAVALGAAALAVLSLIGAVVGRPMSAWGAIPAAAVTGVVVLGVAALAPLVWRAAERLVAPERARALAQLRRIAPPERVLEVLRTALRDPALEVGYRRLADGALTAIDGGPLTATPATLRIRLRGEEIGAIVPSTARRHRPAAAIARAAAPFVEAVRMRAELAEANAELEASRRRLLGAEFAEQQRLERDLHDGAQQRLVALGMHLRVLQRTSEVPAELADGIDSAVAQLGTAIAEIRQLAHGLRPSALDDGLEAALADLARRSPSALELNVRAGELPELVATTAYYVVNEAVTNALRHAAASRIRVDVWEADAALEVRVADNGRGGAAIVEARGLRGLADRVHTLGGDFALDSRPGDGTTVIARLPCAS